jgi:MFS transporter, DHA1 family, staphyloferrin A biosynthesis exporter
VSEHHAAATADVDADTSPGGALQARRRRRLGAFQHRDYSYLLIGTMGSQMGDWIQSVGQGWLVFQLTNSAAQLGIFAFVRGMAVLLITPLGGAIADRLNRRHLLTVATALGAINATVVAVLVASGHIALWQLYFTSCVDGVVASLGLPARQVMVFDVVGPDDLTNAVAINSMGNNIVRILGPSLGGLLIGTTGLSSCFFAQALAYLVAVGATLLIRTNSMRAVGRISVFGNIVDGVRYMAKDSLVVTLLLVTLLPSLLVYPYVSFMQVFAEDVYHVGAGGYGILFTGVGFGSIAGAAWVASHASFRRSGWMMLLTDIIYMLCIVAFALSPYFYLGFFFLILAGVANSIYNTYDQTLLQLNISDDYRGRVLSLYLTLSAVTPIGSLAMGAMISSFGAPGVVAGWAMAAALLMTIVTMRSKRARAL